MITHWFYQDEHIKIGSDELQWVVYRRGGGVTPKNKKKGLGYTRRDYYGSLEAVFNGLLESELRGSMAKDLKSLLGGLGELREYLKQVADHLEKVWQKEWQKK